MDLRLEGKRALVTGSSSGIGEGIAKELAKEGVEVVVHGRNRERAEAVAAVIRAGGGKAAVALGDLSRDDEAEQIAKTATAAFGGIDILVNNAGGHFNRNAGWFTPSAEDWVQTFNMNVASAVRMIHHLCEPMKQRGWGRIIQTGSYSGGAQGGEFPAYSAAKAAIDSLSFGLSKDLKYTGVTVNTVAPGLTETPDLEEVMNVISTAVGEPGNRQAAADYLLNELRQTVKRLGKPEDIARLVVFLASPHADFINGALYRIDGGAFPAH